MESRRVSKSFSEEESGEIAWVSVHTEVRGTMASLRHEKNPIMARAEKGEREGSRVPLE